MNKSKPKINTPAQAGSPATPCSANNSNCSLWDCPNIPAAPRCYVYKERENAEYVRSYLKLLLPDQQWRQLILHKSDSLPKGLSSSQFLYHPNEDKVESHRLKFGKSGLFDPDIHEFQIEKLAKTHSEI